MKKAGRKNMEEQLRQEIRACGLPQNKICRAARMDEGTLSCFMLGKQESMRLKTAQRLARVLGYELVLESQRGGSRPVAAKASRKAPARKAAARKSAARKPKRRKARR